MPITRNKSYGSSFLSTTSVTVSWGTATQAGNLLVVVLTIVNPNATRTVTPPSGYLLAVDDSGGSSTRAMIYYYPNAPSRTSDTFTINAKSYGFIGGLAYSGCASSSPLDRTATNPSDKSGNPRVTGTTAATTQANEVCVGITQVSVANASFSGNPANSFTRVESITTPTNAALLERIVSSTGAYSSSVTLSTSASFNCAGAIATFKEAIPTTPQPQTSIALLGKV